MSTSPLLSHHSQAGPSGSQPRLSSPRHTRTQHGHHHFPRPSSSSTSSYAPVLINHTQISQDYLSPPSSNSPTAGGLSLIYPYPLPIASLLDLAYTIYHHRRYLNKSPESGNTTGLLIGGTIARAVILIGVVGCSRQWRSRGGWVAAICGISIGLDIWEDCAERLGARGPKKGSGRGKGESMALYITIFICISEYLLYLILLRLSPPSNKTSNPFSLRLPQDSRQTSVPFAFDSEDLEYTPRSVRNRRFSKTHTRSRSGKGIPSPLFRLRDDIPSRRASMSRQSRTGRSTSNDRIGASTRTRRFSDIGTSFQRVSSERYDSTLSSDSSLSDIRAPGLDDDEVEFSDSGSNSEVKSESGFSSFSESSIIDLPRPLSPYRIIPPSVSVQSGLTLALTGAAQPILGGIVRRTRSARDLARSWGSGAGGAGLGRERGMGERRRDDEDDEESGKQGRRGEGGEASYGTFGNERSA